MRAVVLLTSPRRVVEGGLQQMASPRQKHDYPSRKKDEKKSLPSIIINHTTVPTSVSPAQSALSPRPAYLFLLFRY
jgi:hypothetical protein